MGDDHDRLGKYLWDMFKEQIIQQFRHHPNRDEIIERLATSSFVVEEIDKWFEEAQFYTNLYWNDTFSKLAMQARVNGINQVKFKVVNSGEESQSGQTSGEDCGTH